MAHRVAVLPGDGVGPEVIDAALGVLRACLPIEPEQGLIGGAAIEATGDPLPEATLELCRSADAILVGPVGGPRWEGRVTGEDGLQRLRRELGAWVSLRPARYLGAPAPIRDSIARHADMLVVRDLSDPYAGRETAAPSEELEAGTRRAAQLAFAQARRRRRRVTAVDKASTLEASRRWRALVAEVAREHPEIEFEQRFVDTTCFEILRAPHRFDVVLTENLFGDVLSDQLAALVGSMSLLPAASLCRKASIFRPLHGSAPDVAGRGVANPAGAILSVALLLEHALERPELARAVESAVGVALREVRTPDVGGRHSTSDFTRAVLRNFNWLRWSEEPHAEPASAAEWGV
jgi:3-isopropylmalate dehydrogenase